MLKEWTADAYINPSLQDSSDITQVRHIDFDSLQSVSLFLYQVNYPLFKTWFPIVMYYRCTKWCNNNEWRRTGKLPHLTLCTTCKWAVTMFWPLYLQYPPDRRLLDPAGNSTHHPAHSWLLCWLSYTSYLVTQHLLKWRVPLYLV